jgi:hypothetical protein
MVPHKANVGRVEMAQSGMVSQLNRKEAATQIGSQNKAEWSGTMWQWPAGSRAEIGQSPESELDVREMLAKPI